MQMVDGLMMDHAHSGLRMLLQFLGTGTFNLGTGSKFPSFTLYYHSSIAIMVFSNVWLCQQPDYLRFAFQTLVLQAHEAQSVNRC